MDWTVEDDMVDVFFRATLTGRRGGPTPFVQAGAETSNTGAEAVEPDPGSSGDGHSRGVNRCLELKCGVLWGCPPTPHFIDDPPTAPLRVSVRTADCRTDVSQESSRGHNIGPPS